MADIFLSYAQEDIRRVRQIGEALRAVGWDVWWDRTLAPGVRFRSEIAKQLNAAKCVVVLWSAQAIESDWVIDEAEDGKQRGVLVQAVLDDVKPPHGFRQIHWGSLTQWSGESDAQELLELRAGIERHIVPPGRAREAATAADRSGPQARTGSEIANAPISARLLRAMSRTAGVWVGRPARRKIFVCYRRSDTAAETGRLHDALVDAFGSDAVFIDDDVVPSGADFHERITEQLNESAVMVVVIGQSWVHPRLSQRDDLVRVEIAQALAGRLPVIPVLVQDASMPCENQIPDDLQGLTRRNALELSHHRWREDVRRLVEALNQFMSPE